ncbi:MAG TPA: MerR family transcriptional regulator [Chloroflexota bacterium]|jgi:MerR family transcriptional regulator/heat shock protein HspR
MESEHETGFFVISVAARMLGLHAQTLRAYERQGLVTPSRTKGRIRLYSLADIQQAQLIRRLVDDLGVNLAGVEVILRLTSRISDLEQEVVRLRERIGQQNNGARAARARMQA